MSQEQDRMDKTNTEKLWYVGHRLPIGVFGQVADEFSAAHPELKCEIPEPKRKLCERYEMEFYIDGDNWVHVTTKRFYPDNDRHSENWVDRIAIRDTRKRPLEGQLTYHDALTADEFRKVLEGLLNGPYPGKRHRLADKYPPHGDRNYETKT